MQVDPELYAEKQGQTDTETMFLLGLSLGMMEDPQGGICRMIEKVEEARHAEGVDDSFRMTVAISDGASIYAARYASHGPQPSLYHSTPGAELEATSGKRIKLPADGTLVLSEPLDEVPGNWKVVPETSWLVLSNGVARSSSLF